MIPARLGRQEMRHVPGKREHDRCSGTGRQNNTCGQRPGCGRMPLVVELAGFGEWAPYIMPLATGIPPRAEADGRLGAIGPNAQAIVADDPRIDRAGTVDGGVDRQPGAGEPLGCVDRLAADAVL